MPTALPTRPAADRRLSWSQVARLVVLVARLRLLDLRLNVRVSLGMGFDDRRLLRLMRRWLALYDRIGALLPGMPEPEHVRQVRAILAGPDQTPATVDRTRRAP